MTTVKPKDFSPPPQPPKLSIVEPMPLSPPLNGFTLSNEAGLRCANPDWQLVEKVVRKLDTGKGNSFCCLQLFDHCYIQTLHGFNGYHLEWRVVGLTRPKGYIHYRAAYPGGSAKLAKLIKVDFVSSGEQADLLHLDDVVDAFRSFYDGTGRPVWLLWRELDI